MVDDTIQSSMDPRKRKCDDSQELLQDLQRADERFLQHSKDMNDALLQKMEENTSALSGLMGRGCVLSPLLYSLFIHDSVATHRSSTIVKFADDTTAIGIGLLNDDDERRPTERRSEP
ncbi:hypothetical protein L3Q82_005231 [Scortum barcoo]|uniref:Uncharacterized protein n=1 Tax=Scortum barcoo TaxID=214431 RepID=A0ACB8VCK4_9TELE|nr:hypothetical protein L3Q82_005231 [Scortum barcoo]